jgi:hypothetical protein
MARPVKITEAQKRKAFELLTKGWSLNKASKAAGVSCAWLSRNKPLVKEAQNVKKEVHDDFVRNNKEDLSALAKKLLAKSHEALTQITARSMGKQSAAANATTLGILLTKLNEITGGESREINIVANSENLAVIISSSLSANKTGNAPIAPAPGTDKPKSD